MNRIVLIGNGFDLAHGLKTRYEDFINWYWENWGRKLLSSSKKSETDGLCSFAIREEVDIPNWNYVFGWYYKRQNPAIEWNPNDAISLAKNNEICNFSLSPFLERISKSVTTKKWVDIENEYYALLIQQTSPIIGISKLPMPDPKVLNFQLECIKAMLIDYLKQEEKKEVKFISSIKEKIYRPIKRREIAVANLNYSGNRYTKVFTPNNVMLLNFNYTKTEQQYIDPGANVRVNHIHGSLDVANSIIFGYGDELDNDFEKLKNLNNNECLRNMKSIRYLDADNYRRMLDFIESAPFQVCIMGHSCGNSDRTLLNTLFEHRFCISVKPYFYKREDGTDNYLELIQNISRNFTDMKLMRDRVVNKLYCEPLT